MLTFKRLGRIRFKCNSKLVFFLLLFFQVFRKSTFLQVVKFEYKKGKKTNSTVLIIKNVSLNVETFLDFLPCLSPDRSKMFGPGTAGHVRSSARDGCRILFIRQRKSGILRSRTTLHGHVEGKPILNFECLRFRLSETGF